MSPERLRLETSHFVYGLAIWSISLAMTYCPLSGRGQGHVSNLYILDLENFATANKLSRCIGYDKQTCRRSACGLHLRRSSASWLNAQVYCTLVDCNSLTPLLRFVFDLSYKLFLHCYAAVRKNFDWPVASRGPSAVAELLVICGYLR